MKDILASKLNEYASLYPPKAKAKKWIDDSNQWMSLYTALCLQGIRIEKRKLVSLLEGQIMEDINMSLYGFCFRFKDIYKSMVSAIQMQASLNRKLLDEWYKELFLVEGPIHRKASSVVYDIGFIPCHHSEIDEQMDKLLRSCELASDPAESSARAHLGIVKIYPYGRESIIMGLLAGYYYLLKAGIPLPSYPVNEDEYCRLLFAWINEGNAESFMDMHMRSLVNRMETVLTVCYQAQEASGEK